MENVLALALESAGAIGHDALALSGSDLAAEVCLARLAELALLTLGSTVCLVSLRLEVCRWIADKTY